LIDTIRYDMVD